MIVDEAHELIDESNGHEKAVNILKNCATLTNVFGADSNINLVTHGSDLFIVFITEVIVRLFKSSKFITDFRFKSVPLMELFKSFDFEEGSTEIRLKVHTTVLRTLFSVEATIDVSNKLVGFRGFICTDR